MNALELSKSIGLTGQLQSDRLTVSVRILDAKTAYGSIRYQVSPISGTGSVWVDSSRVTIEQKERKEVQS